MFLGFVEVFTDDRTGAMVKCNINQGLGKKRYQIPNPPRDLLASLPEEDTTSEQQKEEQKKEQEQCKFDIASGRQTPSKCQ